MLATQTEIHNRLNFVMFVCSTNFLSCHKIFIFFCNKFLVKYATFNLTQLIINKLQIKERMCFSTTCINIITSHH